MTGDRRIYQTVQYSYTIPFILKNDKAEVFNLIEEKAMKEEKSIPFLPLKKEEIDNGTS